MPTNTYVALDKITVGTATNSITFSSINQSYTDLVIVTDAGASVVSEVDLRVGNSSVDTGSNYSRTVVSGSGSSVTSTRNSNQTYWRPNFNSVYDDANGKSNHIFQFMNYSNTNVFKTMLYRGNSAAYGVDASVNLWRSTAAINIITLYANVAGTKNFLAGSTFSLYGIAAASVGAKATGGVISSDSQYYYHTFLSTDTFTPLQSLTTDCLVVAGGGGAQVGGGGAGGFRTASLSVTATAYTVTVGAGGVGAVFNGSSTKGGNSTFSTITSTGGGQSGKTDTNPRNGFAGGSGGGGAGDGGTSSSGGAGNEGGYSPVEGYAGGGNGGNIASPYPGGGGGGSAAIGSNASASLGGAGGAGTSSLISGTTNVYAVGGDGGIGASSIGNGANGTANRGNGGFGSRQTTTGIGGNGGSGIVVIRYAK